MEPVTERRWVRRGEEADSAKVGKLVEELGIRSLAARVLAQRGLSDAECAREFLDASLSLLPDPFLLSGMEQAVERLVNAVESREPILIHGDYDVDGISGTALLVESLRSFGAEVEYFIPHRMKDGYGLSAEAMRQAASAGIRIVLSVDCGISAVEQARLAAELGLELIITDHHQPPESLPVACATVNPHLPGCRFPFKELAGVGVAFFLLVALRKRLREVGRFAPGREPDLRYGLDLVALGTIADVVGLTGVNRILTRVGLELLEQGRRPGIQALKEVAGVKAVSCGAVGFRLAPRLNAAGRLEEAARGVELLLEDSERRSTEIATELDRMNRERQEVENATLQDAIERLQAQGDDNRRTIVLAAEGWHPGVIGIVASRLVERYHRPTVLIALEGGRGKGSGRSVAGFHLYRALKEVSASLVGFGGHEYAAGLSIAEDNVMRFAAALEELACREMSDDMLLPKAPYDGEILLEEVGLPDVQELARLAPFGPGNPEPVFVVRGVRVHYPQVVGERHLRFAARQDGYSCQCIGFDLADRLVDLSGDLDLLFTPTLNQWRGKTTLQLRIKDLRPSAS